MSPITTLDLDFQGVANSIASFLIETGEGPILVETGPHSCFPILKSELARKGYTIEDVRHVFLTHIHLDHAGAAWAFAERGAKIYLHPMGHRHMGSPEKLMASAAMIYGDQMDTLWGLMKPIMEQQLIKVEDGETIQTNGVQLMAHHTPGHAKHHIAWQMGDTIFTGDVAGVKIGSGPVMPPCPPPDIQIEDWLVSIAKIKLLKPKSIMLTHFGELGDVDSHLSELESILWDWANWIKPHFEQSSDREKIIPKFQAYVHSQLISAGVDSMGIDQYEKANPAWMSVSGLMRYWKLRSRE